MPAGLSFVQRADTVNRSTACMTHVEDQLGVDVHMVSYNGALGLTRRADGRKPLFRRPVPRHHIETLVQFADDNGLVLNYYDEHQIHVKPTTAEHDELIERYRKQCSAVFNVVDDYARVSHVVPCKIVALTHQTAAVTKQLEDLFAGQMQVIRGEYFVECLAPGVHKGAGLQGLCEHWQIPRERVVAFGDGLNDIGTFLSTSNGPGLTASAGWTEYLQYAGLGIAMANAYPETKSAASRVTLYDNVNDGVAHELEGMLEKGLFGPTTTFP